MKKRARRKDFATTFAASASAKARKKQVVMAEKNTKWSMVKVREKKARKEMKKRRVKTKRKKSDFN